MEDEHGLQRLVEAFPPYLEEEVRGIIDELPPISNAGTPDAPIMVSRHLVQGRRTTPIVVQGFEVRIPSRTYAVMFRPPSVIRDIFESEHSETLRACMTSRHCDGHFRQNATRKLMESSEPWVVPFVVALVGEYIPAIQTYIWRDLPEPSEERATVYREFLQANRDFFELTRQRVFSYWNCYYKTEYMSRDHYPGFAVLEKLKRLAAA